jgi:glycosyltransferase involved in cell wall biosynthesis
VRNGETGILVPPQNVPALTAALRSLLCDPARRHTLGEAARRFVLAEADSRVCVKRIEEFYLAVVERCARKGANG